MKQNTRLHTSYFKCVKCGVLATSIDTTGIEIVHPKVPNGCSNQDLTAITYRTYMWERKGLPQFYDCGICGHWHPLAFDGDCRDDANRLTSSFLEDTYGNEGQGWLEVDMPY